MDFSSVQDILKFALSKEEASVRFYDDLAIYMGDASTRSLFSIMARTEREHVESLRLEIQKLGFTVKIDPETPDSASCPQHRLDMDEDAQTMDFITALELAIQKERASFRLYSQILGANKDDEFEDVLMELAEEEMRHVLQLEREYEAITNRKY